MQADDGSNKHGPTPSTLPFGRRAVTLRSECPDKTRLDKLLSYDKECIQPSLNHEGGVEKENVVIDLDPQEQDLILETEQQALQNRRGCLA